jgi:hypothetical protein
MTAAKNITIITRVVKYYKTLRDITELCVCVDTFEGRECVRLVDWL